MIKKSTSLLLIGSLWLVLLSACVTHQPVQYLEGSFDANAVKQVRWQEPVMQPGDLISIQVHSDNADAAALYNQGGGFSAASTTLATAAVPKAAVSGEGYLIGQDGIINIMGVGPLLVVGKTKKQVAETLQQYFIDKNLLKNPVVEVRNLNFKITVMGEVLRPGSFSIPTERVNLLEAIGLAGDFSPYARKEMVTVIREINGERSFVRLNTLESGIFSSPYYQLQQNDIVMVPSNEKKEVANDQLTIRYITLGTSMVSVIAILINVFR